MPHKKLILNELQWVQNYAGCIIIEKLWLYKYPQYRFISILKMGNSTREVWLFTTIRMAEAVHGLTPRQKKQYHNGAGETRDCDIRLTDTLDVNIPRNYSDVLKRSSI